MKGNLSSKMWRVRQTIPKKVFDASIMDYFDDYDAELVGLGGSAAVLAIDSSFVIKVFADGHERTQDLAREVQIFEQLNIGQSSPSIVQYFQQFGRGIVMERLERTLRQQLSSGLVPRAVADRWTLQICQGLKFLHACGIFHGDLGCQNILIDAGEDAKICDFAGSKIGNEDAWIRYQVRCQHPKYEGQQPNVATEIFAFGSVIFEIATTKQPYESLPDSSVRKKFAEGCFPLDMISASDVRDLVERCWRGKYGDVSTISKELSSRWNGLLA